MRVFVMQWKRFAVVVLIAAAVFGCSKKEEPTPDPVFSKEAIDASKKAAAKPAPAATPGEPAKAADATAPAPASDLHQHIAPHGGALVMIGEHAGHLEIVFDANTGTLTAYALDGEAEKPVRLNSIGMQVKINVDGKDEKTLTLKPVENVLTGETGTSTSQYAAQSDDLKGLTAFKGRFPELSFQGLELEDLAFSFPEGNE